MNIHVPDYVLKIVKQLQNKNYSAYIVGGAVRDSLLGISPKDWDVATSALPEQIKEVFSDGSLFKAHPIGEKYGTITVAYCNDRYDSVGKPVDRFVEVTTFRKDGVYFDGRRPDKVEFVDDITQDLSRRDFTMNAMAYDPVSKVLLDPFGGYEHLQAGRLKFVGNAAKRIIEDPLRILRAVRFAAKYHLSFCISEEEEIREHRCLLNRVSIERINKEFSEMLLGNSPVEALFDLCLLDLMFLISPMHKLGQRQTQTYPHKHNVMLHMFNVVGGLAGCGNLPLLLAGLFHDIGKPLCATEDDRGIHFYGHEKISAAIAKEELKRLKYPSDVINKTVLLIENHMFSEDMKDKGIRNLVKRVNYDWDIIDDLFELKESEIKSMQPDFWVKKREPLAKLKERVNKLRNAMITMHNLPINGTDIIEELKIQPGKEVGNALELAHKFSWDGSKSKKEILNYLKGDISWRI